MIGSLSGLKMLMKQTLVSDIARIYDVLGWCLPSIVKPKILLQRLWKDKLDWDKLDWDKPFRNNTQAVWQRWRN